MSSTSGSYESDIYPLTRISHALINSENYMSSELNNNIQMATETQDFSHCYPVKGQFSTGLEPSLRVPQLRGRGEYFSMYSSHPNFLILEYGLIPQEVAPFP